MVLFRAAVTVVAGQDDDILMMSLLHGAHYRDTVYNAAVKHRHTVDADYLADIRQTAAGTDNVEQTLTVLFLRKIAGTPRQTVGGNHLEDVRIIEESIVIVRQQFVGKIVIKQLTVEDTSLRDKMTQTYIFVLGKEIYVGDACAAYLPAHIRQTVAGSRRHSDDIMEITFVLHESVEHAACEDTAHASAFKNQSRISVNSHKKS